MKGLAIGLAAVFALLAVAGCGTEEESGGGGQATQAEQKQERAEPKETAEQSNKATDENTPHVGPNGSVIVDTLTWRVLSTRTAGEVGNELTRERADGVYVVVKARVRNGKDESVTITSEIATLKSGDDAFKTDNDGTTALQLAGEETFFIEDLGPDVATTGFIVFDVPRRVLRQRPEICFGELGFGSTEGCIRLETR